MKKALLTIVFTILAVTVSMAQERNEGRRRPPFSPQEFQAKQKEYITNKAELTDEEADAFFPLFFELQKKKHEIERDVRKDFKKPDREKPDEEECRKFAYKMADAKIKIAKLEKEYIDKYLKVISACKLHRIQHAENSFQRDLMRKMTQPRDGKRPPHESRR